MKPLAAALTLTAALGFAVTAPAFAGGSCNGNAHHGQSSASTGQHDDTIVGVAAEAGIFNTLLAAAEAAGLVETLQGDGPLTVLAPTDEAFAKLPEGTVESLLHPDNKDQLVAILTYHVIPGKVKAKDALKLGDATTVQGQHVAFAVQNGQPRVNGVNLVTTDITTSNGVIHVIDEVLLPDSSS